MDRPLRRTLSRWLVCGWLSWIRPSVCEFEPQTPLHLERQPSFNGISTHRSFQQTGALTMSLRPSDRGLPGLRLTIGVTRPPALVFRVVSGLANFPSASRG